jgi:oligopeptide transport system substrate-binding protein
MLPRLVPGRPACQPLGVHGRFWLVVLVIVFLTGCGRRESLVETGLKTGTLHYGNGAEPQELDPHLTTGTTEGAIQGTLFEGLVVFDPRTGHPIPAAASSWESSSDGRVVTFSLRPNGRWSDGVAVTAQDFVRSFQRLLTPSLGADYATEFYFIQGAREFHHGKTKDASTVGVTAVNPHTLRFTLLDPVPQLLPLLASSPGLPVPSHVLERFGALDRRGSAWTRPGNIIGNGPYVLKEWRAHQHIVVTRSPTYSGPFPAQLNAIHFYPIQQADSEERMFRAGQLHYTYSIPLTKVAVYQREQPDVIRVAPEARNYYYVFNVNRAPFGDVRVRRALALAIDRQRLATQVLRAGQLPARRFVPTVLFDTPMPDEFAEDAAMARELLAAAGFPGGAGLGVLPLLINNTERNRLIAEAIQEMWRQHLGIRVEIVLQEWKVYLDSLKQGDYQLSFDGWGFTNAQQFYSLLTTGNSASYNLWSDPEYDSMVAAAAATSESSRRLALYAEMETHLARTMPVIPLFFNVSTHLVRPEVQGWHTNPIDVHHLPAVSLGR